MFTKKGKGNEKVWGSVKRIERKIYRKKSSEKIKNDIILWSSEKEETMKRHDAKRKIENKVIEEIHKEQKNV